MPIMDFVPDIIHANDWQTALIPVFLDCFYRYSKEYQKIKTVFTIHNIEFQGKYNKNLIYDILGLPYGAESLVEDSDCVNYMKGGIESAARVTTVSETYAEELMHPFYSFGLDPILGNRKFKMRGVINGIDTVLYDPKTDKALFKNYDVKSLADRVENKKGLLEMLDLPFDPEKPVIGMVTRLTEQKGLDLVAAVIEEILSANLQFIVLGKGDWKYEEMFRSLEGRYPKKLKAVIGFSSDIASKIYAGSDMFLMPSKFEPCGLSQMIAMRYGSIPIVRETGGLKDSVAPFDGEKGSGFTFKTYNSYDMLDAVWRAFGTYQDQEKWQKVITNAMNEDFSWEKSAKKYIEIYKDIK